MSESGDLTPPEVPRGEPGLSAEQLRGFQWGIAATVMPVREGWRVHYFSIPAFDDEPGTDFPTFTAAISAIVDVLPEVNSDSQKGRAHEQLRRQLRQSSRNNPDDDPLT